MRIKYHILFSFLIGFLSFVFFQNFTVIKKQNRLSLNKNICVIPIGKTTCTIEGSFDLGETVTGCLYVKSDLDASLKPIVCGKQSPFSINWVQDKAFTLELHEGNTPTESSKRLSTVIFGIRDLSQKEPPTEELINVSPQKIHRMDKNHITSTWDGRIHFSYLQITSLAGASSYKTSIIASLYKPEVAEQKTTVPYLNLLGAADTFSPSYLLDSDLLTSTEIANANRNMLAKGFLGIQNIGKNKVQQTLGAHLAITPTSGSGENPYISDATGTPQMFASEFETYSFYVYSGSPRVGSVESPYNTADLKKFFLSRFKVKITVKFPKTVNAEIVWSEVTAAEPLYDNNGDLLHGYEPSITQNGRLLVWSGIHRPDLSRNVGGGWLQYSYNSHPTVDARSWSKSTNVAQMYEMHGPGALSNEALILGHKFSKMFPVAKYPLREFDNTKMDQFARIKGSYPWVSLDGSEIMFATIPTFHGPSRNGIMIVGHRTHGLIRHMDGLINTARGSVTDAIQWEVNDNHPNPDMNQYSELTDAYESQMHPQLKMEIGNQGYNQVLSNVFLTEPGSWNPHNKLLRHQLPYNPFHESYGVQLTGNRYFEIIFPDFKDDLLVYLPMKEPVKFNKDLLVQMYNNPLLQYERKEMRNYVTDKTYDVSKYSHVATLSTDAQYPYEYHDAINNWKNSRILRDVEEGKIGNAIFFKNQAHLNLNLNPDALSKLQKSGEFTSALWVKSISGNSFTIMQIDRLLRLFVLNGKLKLDVLTTSQPVTYDLAPDSPSTFSDIHTWNQVTLTNKLGLVTTYINGIKISELSIPYLRHQSLTTGAISIGPSSSGIASTTIMIDEYYLYQKRLSEKDVRHLSWIKTKTTTTSPPANSLKIELGRQIFSDNILSRNKTVSCASCHIENKKFADGLARSKGFAGRLTLRNTPTIIASSQMKHHGWDGTVDNLRAFVLHPVIHPHEMGIDSPQLLLTRVTNKYAVHFNNIYGVKERRLSEIADALSSYISSLTPAPPLDSPPHLDVLQGKKLFEGKANCIACHSGEWKSDQRWHNVGLNQVPFPFDSGRFMVDNFLSHRSAFRTPPLIALSQTAPYFHDGSAATLRDVITHYNNGGVGADRQPLTSPLLHPLNLSEEEISHLEAYLTTL